MNTTDLTPNTNQPSHAASAAYWPTAYYLTLANPRMLQVLPEGWAVGISAFFFLFFLILFFSATK